VQAKTATLFACPQRKRSSSLVSKNCGKFTVSHKRSFPKPAVFPTSIIKPSNQARKGNCGFTDRNLVFRAPACNWRCAGEGELLFALVQSGAILPELVEGGHRQVLPVFWRFCPIAKSVGGRQRPGGKDEG